MREVERSPDQWLLRSRIARRDAIDVDGVREPCTGDAVDRMQSYADDYMRSAPINDNGEIDTTDYKVWKNNFGQ